jgi:hypothetical protein
MKLSKNFFLLVGLLFVVDFSTSLFDHRLTRELFLWDVNIWIYRGYRLAIALLFIGLYFKHKKKD